ncbi:uncharacterized protein LOC108035117 [Drosophila biarmipes]|uniref:uncharacterized protein LOC108035117 n=1 Tax=Drosophila biarmipes TaxID=125945 RepID=UPI0007E744CA|nr:uncharacterized protein LOC108035117 [Drosophila biarmipes]
MRVPVIFGLVAFLAISLVTAYPSAKSTRIQDSSNNQTTSRPFRWPRWGGIGPVILNTPRTPLE